MKYLLFFSLILAKIHALIFYVDEQCCTSQFSKIYKYRFYNDEGAFGYVEKNWKTMFIHYPLLGKTPFFLYEDVYSASGFPCIDNIKSVAGSRYDDMKFYDRYDRFIGAMSSEVILLSNNYKYTLYDDENKEFASAEYEPHSGVVTLDDINGKPIAILTALYERNQKEFGVHWKMNLFDKKSIDMRILKIFMSYIVNTRKHDKMSEIIKEIN